MTLTRDQKISTLVSIIAIGFAAISFFYYVRGFLLHMPFPDNTFLPVLEFGDFNWLVNSWHQNHFAGVGYGHVYFPAAYLIIDPFSRLAFLFASHLRISNLLAIGVFEAFVTGFLFLWACLNLKALWPPETIMRALICTFMTYPVMFVMVTGNFEGLLFVSLALFIIFYDSGRVALSLPFLGLAIAMKVFPATLCVLFLADKKYRALLGVAAWSLVLTLLPLLIFEGGFRYGLFDWFQHMQASQKMYFDLMVVNRAGNHFGHSLLSATRVLMGQTGPLSQSVLSGYAIFAIACFVGVAFYVIRYEMLLWKRVALLICAMCLLPYTSGDYKLLHFYLPLFLFINQNRVDRQDLLYVILFGLLMIPKSYFKLYHLDFYTTNVVVNAGVMIVMVATIIGTGLRAKNCKVAAVRSP